MIYYPHIPREKVYLFFIYAKNERENPTEAQKDDVRKAVKIIQDEAR